MGAALVATAAVLAGCGVTGGSGGTESVSAVFADVGGLVSGAPVQMADIQIGNVTSIALDGTRARVTMTIRRSARVPVHVIAELKRTTILGQKYIALIPSSGHGPSLRNGATIARTEVVPGIQQLVSAGAEVFGAINASSFASIIDAGGQGFGGQAPALRSLIGELDAVVTGYANHTQEIRSLIGNLATLGTTMAPASRSDAQSLAQLAQTTATLSRESGRFTSLLQALDNLSVQGRAILESSFPEITSSIHGLAVVVDEVAARQQDLAGLLRWLPANNTSLASTTVNGYLQILNNLVVCGIPGGGSSPSDAATTCAPGAPPAAAGGGGG